MSTIQELSDCKLHSFISLCYSPVVTTMSKENPINSHQDEEATLNTHELWQLWSWLATVQIQIRDP